MNPHHTTYIISVILISGALSVISASCNTGDDIVTNPGVERGSSITTASNSKSSHPETSNSPGNADDSSGSINSFGNEDDNSVAIGSMTEADKAVQSELRNAAVAMESVFTEDGTYSIMFEDLVSSGFNPTANIVITIITADSMRYCMESFHVNYPQRIWFFDSHDGMPQSGNCR